MVLINIIGLPRSGTTLLGRTLAAAENVRYLEEPNPLWRFRNWHRLRHEQFGPEHATGEVSSHIRRSLLPKQVGDDYIVEKTPANALRVPFVEAVVPEARILFITRRSEDVQRSMLNKWRSGSDDNGVRLDDARPFRELRGKFAKLRFAHFSELPLYLIAEVVARKSAALHGYTDFWGPQFEGWQAYRGQDPETVVAVACERMEQSLLAGISGCRSRNTVIAYEDLVAAPEMVLRRALIEIGCDNLDPSAGLRFFARDART